MCSCGGYQGIFNKCIALKREVWPQIKGSLCLKRENNWRNILIVKYFVHFDFFLFSIFFRGFLFICKLLFTDGGLSALKECAL